MKRRRKTWQHDFEEISEAQFSLYVKTLGWAIDRFGRDYGEDLNIRIFEQGNPTGHDFYVQLKGSDNIQQYALTKNKYFHYAVDVINLQQWQRFTWPVIFVLWDITQNVGYWLHLQPFIEESLEANPNWLENPRSATKPKRNIRIPSKHIVRSPDIGLLKGVIDAEYEKTSFSRRYFKQLQEQREETLKRTLAPQLGALDISRQHPVLPPKVHQQARITQCQATIAADPSDVEAWLELAEIHYELKELDKALATINRAWELNQKSTRIINVRACILAEYAMAKGEPKSLLHEAITLFDSLREKVTIAGLVDYNIGNCYAGLGEHQKAVEYYNQALSANPKAELAARIWKNRGTSFFHLDNCDEEISSYKQALEQDPNLYQAYTSWAATESHRGNYEHAEELLAKAFRVKPEIELSDYPQLYSLAYVLWRLGKLAEAYRRVNEVLALRPEHKDGLLLKGHLLSELWEADPVYIPSAMSFFKSRLLDDPNDMFTRSELYWIYNSQGYQDDARLILEETVQLEKVPPQLLYRYAMLLEAEQRFPEAISYLEAAYGQSQDHHIVHALARLKEKVGDHHGAIGLYRLALRDVTDPLPILHSIADGLHFLGDYRECVRITSTAIHINPRDEISWTNLIYSLDQLGRGEASLTLVGFVRRLRTSRNIDDETIRTVVERLQSILRTEFGEEFTQTVLPSDASLVAA